MNGKLIDLSTEDWMRTIWNWADDYELDEWYIPRNKDGLLGLTRLYIDTRYEYAGYYENCDRLPDDYYNTPLYHMKEVPKELSYLPYLEDLYFNNVDVSKLIESISHLKNLQSLDTFATEIEFLPENINELQKLEYLQLWESKLRTLPETICDISSLKHLHVRAKNLQDLPKNLAKLQNLQSLELESNQVIDIPSSIFKLSQLKHLSIYGTKIKEIPSAILNLKNLESLKLITENSALIPPNVPIKLPNLSYLRVSSHLWASLSGHIDKSKVDVMLF